MRPWTSVCHFLSIVRLITVVARESSATARQPSDMSHPCLSGGMGIGKTFFFQTLNPEPMPVLSFNQCFLWKYEDLGEWLDSLASRDIVLDDIGWETGRASNFGTRFDTLQVVLDARLRAGRARTHITTNCTNDELVEKYDPHVVDRIYECCKCFVLPPAESKREALVDYTYLRNAEYNRQNGREEL